MARRVETEPGARTEAQDAGDREGAAGLTAVERLPILLVDDRPENLQALEAVLAPLGFPLVSAGSGREALRLLLERDFALILLDVRMPGLDGIETARLIKGRARSRDVPIVFLTAARDDVADIIAGYGVGAVDYVLKPFEPEVLRSKVTVFAELESSRRALKRSEAFLRGAFEAAPIGKTVLDSSHRIVRSNPAFARLLVRPIAELEGAQVQELCHPEDRAALTATLEAVQAKAHDAAEAQSSVDLRLRSSLGSDVWVAAAGSLIEPSEFADSLLLVQWVDLTARRRAEEARAELILEQSARAHAEAIAARLEKLQTLADALESVTLDELLPALTLRLAELFGAEVTEITLQDRSEPPRAARVAGGRLLDPGEGPEVAPERWVEAPIRIEGEEVAMIRLALRAGQDLSDAERSLLQDASERTAVSLHRALLHEEEHRIAVELQRGLLPKTLPEVEGIELATHYEAAGLGAQVGGDWYDAFELSDGKIGLVVGDVAGSGIAAASTMGELRSVTHGFAIGDEHQRGAGEVMTRLNRHQLALSSDQLVTVLYGVFDRPRGMVYWSSAGHPPPLLRRASGECQLLDGGGGLLGIEDLEYEEMTERLERHDAVIFYSDGLVERRGESLDVGMQRLADAAACGPDEPEALCQHILETLLSSERELHDDVTTVVVRFV